MHFFYNAVILYLIFRFSESFAGKALFDFTIMDDTTDYVVVLTWKDRLSCCAVLTWHLNYCKGTQLFYFSDQRVKKSR